MLVAVVGATGVLGRNVLPRLLERGHRVRALVRREEQADSLRRVGVVPVLGDVFDVASLERVAQGCEAALHLATAIPKDRSDWTANDRIRREGTRNLLAAILKQRVTRYIQQSITLLYGAQGESLADERTALQPNRVTASAADMESMVVASDLDWCILRGGRFYGRGTGRDEQWRQLARSGKLLLPGDGSGLVSLVHVVDMAGAVVKAVEAAPARSIYNVVDDEPVSYRVLYNYVVACEGVSEPHSGGDSGLPSLGCSNARIKAQLSWQPAHPTFRSGLI